MKIKFIKTIITAIITIALTFMPISAFAVDNCSADLCNGDYPDSVKAACGCASSAAGGDKISVIILNIINAIIAILGVVAVIFIFVGGIGYMTSSGDPGKVKKAKDTIFYAVIGLIICVLSFAITQFIINAINNS